MGLVRLSERDWVSSSRISLDVWCPPASHAFVVNFRKASRANTCDGGILVLKINIFLTVQCFDVVCVVIPFSSQKLVSRAKD